MRWTVGGLSESEPLAKLSTGLANTAASVTKWKSLLKVDRGYMPHKSKQIQQIP
jgi:hypothetical protein